MGYKTLLTNLHSNNIYKLSEPPVIINGQVATTMFEILNPSQRKREVIARHFDVEVSSIKELIDKPDLKYEIYRKPEELFNEVENTI